jgi:hypothetical protein
MLEYAYNTSVEKTTREKEISMSVSHVSFLREDWDL